MTKLFGSSGIRGDAASFFTNQLSFDLGRVFALLIKNHNQTGMVAVGMDPRDSSERIMSALIKGLRYENISVYNDHIIPIPAMNWALRSDKSTAGSIMVTGSHIKPHLNGLKFFILGNEILKSHEKEIEQLYDAEKGKINYDTILDESATKLVTESTHKDDYISYLLSHAKPTSKSLNIVVDAGNGAQSTVAPEFLKQLGHQVIEMNTDTNAPLYSRDTEVNGDFVDLQSRVVASKADLGIGFDSDGDRVIFIDELGNFIPGDYSGALIASSLGGDSTVTPINTSQVTEKTGLKVVRTKVGSPYVVGKMQEIGAKFGFEANGGGIFSEMYSRDGGRSTIEFLNLMVSKNVTASVLVSTLPKFYILRDKIDYDWSKKVEITEKARKAFPGIKTEEIDGLKIWLTDDTWILFRSSANAPEFRVFVESPTKAKAEELLAAGIKLISDYRTLT
jgi:phosphomannomutase/phosphoglucomutase